MSEMVERVAEAIRLRAIERGNSIHPVMVRHLAAAAIEAMREPTEAMIDEGGDNYSEGDRAGNDMAREVWTSMIDAALA